MIEVGQDIPGSAFECSAQRNELREGARDARVAETVYFGLHQGLTADFVGIAVGVDDVLVDAPGDLECDVAIAGEQAHTALDCRIEDLFETSLTPQSSEGELLSISKPTRCIAHACVVYFHCIQVTRQ